MAGYRSIIHRKERAITVRPQDEFAEMNLNPVHAKPEKKEREKTDEGDEGQSEWDVMAGTYEELETRMAEQFEKEQDNYRNGPPVIPTPDKPTKEEWGRHQTIHTLYVAWCPHCTAVRNARRNHPGRGRKGKIVPDTEGGEGPTNVSLDYMYLHERVGKYRGVQHNPFYLVVIEHGHGRCWAHQVPNKGINDGAYWVPKRVLQHLENNGFGKKARILVKLDKEPSIICVQKALQDFKPDIIPVNSFVGESACNCRVENAIRGVQERSQHSGINSDIALERHFLINYP